MGSYLSRFCAHLLEPGETFEMANTQGKLLQLQCNASEGGLGAALM